MNLYKVIWDTLRGPFLILSGKNPFFYEEPLMKYLKIIRFLRVFSLKTRFLNAK